MSVVNAFMGDEGWTFEPGEHVVADPINNAEMYVILKDKSEWRTARTQEDIEIVIRQELGNVPGVIVNLTQPIQMTVDELMEGIKAELAIKLFGDDLAVLKTKADEIASVIQGHDFLFQPREAPIRIADTAQTTANRIETGTRS